MKFDLKNIDGQGAWPDLLTVCSYYVFITTNESKTKFRIETTGYFAQRLRQLQQDNNEVCLSVIYWETFNNASDALTRKREIKKLSHKKKVKLITDKNPGWQFFNNVIANTEKLLML